MFTISKAALIDGWISVPWHRLNLKRQEPRYRRHQKPHASQFACGKVIGAEKRGPHGQKPLQRLNKRHHYHLQRDPSNCGQHGGSWVASFFDRQMSVIEHGRLVGAFKGFAIDDRLQGLARKPVVAGAVLLQQEPPSDFCRREMER